MAAPKLDTSKPIEWKDAAGDGSFSGTKKVTAEIGGNKKCYIITITKASSKDDAEAQLAQKIHELVSVALMVNVTTEKSLLYKGGKYSTMANGKEKQLAYLNGGYTDDVVKSRAEKAKQREAFLKKIQNVVNGRNSELDASVKSKIQKKEKLTHADLKKIDPKIKVEYFPNKTDTSKLTAEVIARKIQDWELKKQLAESSLKIYNLKKPAEAEKEEEEDVQEPTPQQITEQGIKLIRSDKPEERNKGVELLEQAAKKGCPLADAHLCYIYYFGKKDLDTALAHGLKAAAAGYTDSQNICIEIYEEQGKLAEKIELLKKGIAANNPYAHYIMAGHCTSGDGVEQSEEQAKEHYRKVIELKDKATLNTFNREVTLAKAHMALGQDNEAKQVLEGAGDQNHDAKKLLQEKFPAAVDDEEEPKVKVLDDDDDDVK